MGKKFVFAELSPTTAENVIRDLEKRLKRSIKLREEDAQTKHALWAEIAAERTVTNTLRTDVTYWEEKYRGLLNKADDVATGMCRENHWSPLDPTNKIPMIKLLREMTDAMTLEQVQSLLAVKEQQVKEGFINKPRSQIGLAEAKTIVEAYIAKQEER